MQLEITGWQIDTLKQALQESDSLWEDRIQQAERGERPNLSIDGARMMQDDLRAILQQIKWQSGSWTVTRGVAIAPHPCNINRVNTNDPMRKIESQMCDAIHRGINWKSANTEVTFDEETNTSSVFLHDNLIATVTDNDMTIFDGGWQINTTKSRLNALCSEFCIKGEGIFQKDFKWFVRKFVGQSPITGKVFNVHDFENGFVFAWEIRRFFLNTIWSQLCKIQWWQSTTCIKRLLTKSW